MSPFEFFFSFYGLVLGLSVVELVAGVARVLHAGRGYRFGVLTPLLAAFVLADITSFWAFAWVDLRGVQVSYAALIGALAIAGLYYVAASLVFPREPLTESADAHFWRHRRTVLLAIMACNLPVFGLALMRNFDGGWPALLIVAFCVYYSVLLIAALAPRRRTVLVALILANLIYVLQFAGSVRGILI